MRILMISAAVAIAAPALAGAQATSKPAPKHESQAQLQREATLGLDSAKAIAMREVPRGRLKAHELEREKGKLIYSFEFSVPGKTGVDEVNVDAMTGAVVSHEHESPQAEAKEAAAESKSKPATHKP